MNREKNLPDQTMTDQIMLDQIMRIVRSGNDFYVAVYAQVKEPEERTAFAYMSDVKQRFLAELRVYLRREPESGGEHISPASLVERLYATVRARFNGNSPRQFANALKFAEDELLRLMERAFEESSDGRVRQILKAHYRQAVVCRDVLGRLHLRLVA
jgi:uncharacterized protein (TIGR02284 family)